MGTERKAIEVFNKWIDCRDAFKADKQCDMRCEECEHNVRAEEMDMAVIVAISALKKQEQDRWIPVTERLPEKDCECRVTEGDFKSVIDCYWSNRKKQFEVWSDYQDDYVPITNVTAWKPKEEPYMEDES